MQLGFKQYEYKPLTPDELKVIENTPSKFYRILGEIVVRSVQIEHGENKSKTLKELENELIELVRANPVLIEYALKDIPTNSEMVLSKVAFEIKANKEKLHVGVSKNHFDAYNFPPLIKALKSPSTEGKFNFALLCFMIADRMTPDIEKMISNYAYPNILDFIHPIGFTALRYILEYIKDPIQRKSFFLNLLRNTAGSIGMDSYGKFEVIMNEFRAYFPDIEITDEEINEVTSPFKNVKHEKISIEIKHRDVHALYKKIIKGRSINISHKGHSIGGTGVDSDLEGIVTQVRITRNRDSKKHPESLACHIKIDFKHPFILLNNSLMLASPLYIRVGADGEFYVRDLVMKGEYPFILDKKDDEGKFADTFSELQYFLLKKLQHLFVRQQPKGANETIEISPDEPLTDNPQNDNANPDTEASSEPSAGDTNPGAETPTEPSAGDTPQDETETPERIEGSHRIDLTTPIESNMGASPLQEEKDSNEKNAHKARLHIEANLEKARKFLDLITSKEIPSTIPEEIEGLIIYRKVKISGETFFEYVTLTDILSAIHKGGIDYNEYYVRTTRAHTKSLPYIKYTNNTTLTTEEADLINAISAKKTPVF